MTDGIEDTDVSEGRRVDPLIGRVIAGKIELVDLLGEGAMGRVYRARHRTLDKVVAIKVLHKTSAEDPALARRFQAEARAASRLDHPHSVRILDFGEDGEDHLLYIAMEFLEGVDLAAVLEKGPTGPTFAMEIMAQTLSALAVAHAQQVIHRDMKPGNIMLVTGVDDVGQPIRSVKVCDFGLAKVVDSGGDDQAAPKTQEGTIMGTPAYMSPEQATGDVTDAGTDVYACGVILYQMLAGGLPFKSENAAGMLMQHILDEPPPLLSRAPDIDPRLAQVVHQAMAKKKAERYPTAREMLSALRAVLRDYASVPPAARVTVPTPQQNRTTGPQATMSSQESLIPRKEVARTSLMPLTLISALLILGAGFIAARASRSHVETTTPAMAAPAMAAPAVTPTQAKQLAATPADKVENDIDEPAPNEPENTAVAIVAEPSSARPHPSGTKRSNRTGTPVSTDPRTIAPPGAPVAPTPKASEPIPAPAETVAPPPATNTEKAEQAPAPSAEANSQAKSASAESPPPKNAAPQRVRLSLAAVQVSGGVSSRQTTEKLTRVLSAFEKCLASTSGSGSILITAQLGFDGDLSRINAEGPEKACVANALRTVRLPRPDTGNANLSFTLDFRTE